MSHWLYTVLRNNYLFWSDYQRRLIRTSRLNGGGIRTLVSSRITRPCKFTYPHTHILINEWSHTHTNTLHYFLLPRVGNIAWDWINSKLYWTDSAQQEIQVYDFINSHRRVIIYTGNTSRPFSIVVDPQNRWASCNDIHVIVPKLLLNQNHQLKFVGRL